jgi:hypothetical protein
MSALRQKRAYKIRKRILRVFEQLLQVVMGAWEIVGIPRVLAIIGESGQPNETMGLGHML